MTSPQPRAPDPTLGPARRRRRGRLLRTGLTTGVLGAMALSSLGAAPTAPPASSAPAALVVEQTIDGVPGAIALDPVWGVVLLDAPARSDPGATAEEAVRVVRVAATVTGEGVRRGQLGTSVQPLDTTAGRVVIDAAERIWTVDPIAGRVLSLDLPSGRQRLYATLPNLRPCLVTRAAPCSATANDDLPRPTDLAFDPAGTLYVSDARQAAIWRIAPRGEPELWYSDALLGAGPEAIALAADGRAVEVIAGGTLLRIERVEDGTAGVATRVWIGTAGAAPSLAVAADGSRWATDGDGSLVEIGPDGTERWRLAPAGIVDLDALGDQLIAVAGSGDAGSTTLLSLQLSTPASERARPAVFPALGPTSGTPPAGPTGADGVVGGRGVTGYLTAAAVGAGAGALGAGPVLLVRLRRRRRARRAATPSVPSADAP